MAEVQGRYNPTKVGLSVKAGKTGTSLGVPGLGFPCFHCRRHAFEPWLRNKDPPCQDSEPGKKKKKTKDPELWDRDSALQVLTPSDSALGSLDVTQSRSY